MIAINQLSDLSPADISALESALVRYYASPPTSYYEIADQAATQYQPDLMPFHCDLVSRVEPGFRILEVGCGSAHLCPQIEARGSYYTGIDHSRDLLERNRAR